MTQLEQKLKNLGWTYEEMQETILDIFHELMELYWLESVEEVGNKYNLVIEENLGFVCEVKEVFALYDEIAENAWMTDLYRQEREKENQYYI